MTPTGNKQVDEWANLYDGISNVLNRYGREDLHGHGDYWLVDDNYGFMQHKIELTSFYLLMPTVINELQQLLAGRPDWEIVVAIDIPGTEDAWPPMGLIIRSDEIIDGLKREYFPEEYRQIRYEGSRPGTDRD